MVKGFAQIKPLSVNEAWKGRRFKSDKYKNYEKSVLYFLPRLDIPDGKLSIELNIGFSNSKSDIDNPVKLFLDILQKKYKFDDARIYQLLVIKEIVKKGSEFIKFQITEYIQ
jgi:Holliday junction resolvase RusA-like endonuclease